MIWAEGAMVRGHRVASGHGNDPRFPGGTIRPQLAAFRAAIPDFDHYLGGDAFAGTINVRLTGFGKIMPGEPDFRIGPVHWTDVFPPEIFLISRAMVRIRDHEHPAFLYIPDPATKPGHYQPTDVVELLSGFLPDLTYGDPVTIGYAPQVLITDLAN
jgi:hypothetical protein